MAQGKVPALQAKGLVRVWASLGFIVNYSAVWAIE